jgi:hypothetical protein
MKNSSRIRLIALRLVAVAALAAGGLGIAGNMPAHALETCGAISPSAPKPEVLNPAVANGTTTTPTLSALLESTQGTGAVDGLLYLTTSSGQNVAGSPFASGSVATGELLSYAVPAGYLTAGTTYDWYVKAEIGCAYATGPTQSFAPASASPGGGTGTNSLTVTGSALTAETAPLDSTACSGAACSVTTVTTGELKIGGDGTDHWLTALTPSLSGIPAGAVINSATLELTQQQCLGGCAADSLEVAQAESPVSGETTGTALAADPAGATNDEGTLTTATFDVTPVVQEWTAGIAPNDGLIVETTDETTATSGEGYYGPSATTSPAQLVISYTSPTAPSAPTQLTTTAGDGGAIVSWGEPANPGYVDGSGNTDNGISSYTVTALNSSGAVAATTTTTGNSVVLSGLTDGTSYTVDVTATNAVGAGAAAAQAGVTPEAVPGGDAQYTNAVSQLLNAGDGLEAGTYTSASGADAGDSESSEFSTWLGYEAPPDMSVDADESANAESDTADSTTLSDTLVSLSPSGSLVTVYTVANENFTTVDASSGTSTSIPGSMSTPVAYTFQLGGTTPAVDQQADADALVDPVTSQTGDTAFSAAIDGTEAPSAEPTSVAMSSATSFASGTATAASQSGGTKANLGGIVSWANSNATSKNDDGYSDDCTDFASRALHYGGGLPENPPWDPPAVHTNDAYWFRDSGTFGTTATYSWGGAFNNSDFEFKQGADFLSYQSQAKAGDIIWVDWVGGDWRGCSSTTHGNCMDHTGIIADVTSKNIYIDQHTPNVRNVPLYKVPGETTWYGSDPNLHTWIAIPYVKY